MASYDIWVLKGTFKDTTENRSVPLSESLCSSEGLGRETQSDRLLAAFFSVCSRDSSELGQLLLCYQFDDVLNNAGLPSIRFHDLRHTAATVLLRNAIPAKIVSSILGHSSTQLTLDTYSHVAIDMQDGAAEAIDKMLNKLC